MRLPLLALLAVLVPAGAVTCTNSWVEDARALADAVADASACDGTKRVVIASPVINLTVTLIINSTANVVISGETGHEILIAPHKDRLIAVNGGTLGLNDLTLADGRVSHAKWLQVAR